MTPDTFKLFVGNIPKSYTEMQLLPLFETIGKVGSGGKTEKARKERRKKSEAHALSWG